MLDRALPTPQPGDLLAIMSSGAYGAVQSGACNTRPLVLEVLVRDDQYAVIRSLTELAELIAMDRVEALCVRQDRLRQYFLKAGKSGETIRWEFPDARNCSPLTVDAARWAFRVRSGLAR